MNWHESNYGKGKDSGRLPKFSGPADDRTGQPAACPPQAEEI
jgi:hypothetical protein